MTCFCFVEEIISDTNAVWFSPDGKKLAYASFNDTDVNVMSIPYYGEPGNLDSQYPRAMNLRYPKVSYSFFSCSMKCFQLDL